ncbi:S-phase kinase-associated protein 2 [Nymphon striatum]|nr:S-phase kinase-associated protein 2 [Nymphon striatum]
MHFLMAVRSVYPECLVRITKRKSPLGDGKENKSNSDSKYESLKRMSNISSFSFCNDTLMKDLGVGLLADVPSSSQFQMETNSAPHKRSKSHPRVLLSSASSSSATSSKVTNIDDCAQDVYDMNTNNNSSDELYSTASSFLRCRNRKTYAEDHSTKISDEVLLQIFKWLPKYSLSICAQTCKRWRRLAFDETLWKRVDASRKQLKVGVVGCIVNRGVQALRLAMAEVSFPLFINEDFLATETKSSNLKYLDLSMAAISTEGLNQILSICGQLRKISLEKCDLDDTSCFFLSNNSHLHTLNMALCRGLSHQGMKQITTGCSRLVELNVGWSNLNKEITELMQNLPLTLKKLNISGLRSYLTDDGIEDLTVSCPNLEELDMSDCNELTSVSLRHITANLMHLRFLAVSRCFSIPPNEYLMLKNVISLECLEIYGVLNEESLLTLKKCLCKININKTLFSTIARPTVAPRRTSIWGIRVRDLS